MFDGLISYLDSIKARDPAPRSRWEVLIYPGVLALGLHRVAHWLFQAELYFLARLINHFSRMITAIDIHPGAQIGRNFFIDHGFVVIGETAIVGNDVTIYQGATLGGTNPTNGHGGKRHPTIGDGAIISLGAAILGPITVGPRARIGAHRVSHSASASEEKAAMPANFGHHSRNISPPVRRARSSKVRKGQRLPSASSTGGGLARCSRAKASTAAS